MDELVSRIMDRKQWPELEMPENLEYLNELADKAFLENTFSGRLSAMLMYHQIVEAMCMHLLDDCHFEIQLALYPATIQFALPKNKMLGMYIKELRESLDFHNKDQFLSQVEAFNNLRNTIVHKMRRTNEKEILHLLQQSKGLFDKIFDLYDEIQDDFRCVFHSFRKDEFIDYIDEEDESEE